MSFTNEDCKYFRKGMCHLATARGICKINDEYYDSVHPCDFMTVPCFDDVNSLKAHSIARELRRYKKEKWTDYTLLHLFEDLELKGKEGKR